MVPAKRDVLRAYRDLYTWGLRAVQYSAPARYTVRDRLRRAFRTNDAASFDQRRVDNTVEFLRGAAREKGLEHRLVKSLVRTWWEENRYKQSNQYVNTWKTQRDKDELRIARTAYEPFNHKIRMLNETMGMCI